VRQSLSFALPAVTLLALTAVVGCQPKSPAATLQDRAERFVSLATSLGHTNTKEVDAYFGPKQLDRRDDPKAPVPSELLMKAQALQTELGEDADAATAARRTALSNQLQHFVTLLSSMTSGKRVPFDEEAKQLYGIVVPPQSEAAAKDKMAQLDALLPGQGDIAFRVASFRNRYIIPGDKREAVFARALEECRRRTKLHWNLPGNENIKVEFTQDVESAWHRYQGHGQSLLQVNPMAVAYMGTPLDMACHEGYPGHHAQFLLRDAAAGPSGLRVEDTLVLLRTPASVLREGAANYGVDLAFLPAERLAFERDVLFPLAGFPTADAEKYMQVHHLISELALSVLPALREYRDGTLSFNSATFRLEKDALVSSPEALLKFVDDYGAYVVGYTVVRDQVRDYVEKSATSSGQDAWAVLSKVVTQLDTAFLSMPGG
jgi:hypothetical protein